MLALTSYSEEVLKSAQFNRKKESKEKNAQRTLYNFPVRRMLQLSAKTGALIRRRINSKAKNLEKIRINSTEKMCVARHIESRLLCYKK